MKTTGQKLDTVFAPGAHPLPKPSRFDIDEMFERHEMTPLQVIASSNVRKAIKRAAEELVLATPAGANQTIALRHLEDAIMRANKAIVEDGQ